MKKLYTITTTDFNNFDIISSQSQTQLESRFYKVVDHGRVTVIDFEDKAKIIFDHNGSLKSVSNDVAIDLFLTENKTLYKMLDRTDGSRQFVGTLSECRAYFSQNSNLSIFEFDAPVWDADGNYNAIESN